MTRACVLCGLLTVFLAPGVGAQEPGTRVPVPHQQQITANPFGLIFGWFNAEYERKLSEDWSLGLGGSYLSLDDDDFGSANGVFRYYPQGAALTGFYIGPRVGVYRVNEFRREAENSGGAGFELGYTWLLGANRNFSVSLGAGATKLFTGEVVPNIRLVNIGWAF